MSSSNKVTLAKLCKQHYHVLPITKHRHRYLLSRCLLSRCLSSRCLSSVFTTLSTRKAKQSIAFGLLLLAGIFTTSVSAQTIVNICDRTAQVETVILAAIPGTSDCTAVTETQLAAIASLDLSNMSISALQSGDFANLTGLTTLRLQGNTFTTPLPVNLFDDFPSTAVIEIDLSPIGDLADIALTLGGTTTINIANAFISKDATGTDRDLSFSTTLSGTSATATVNEGVATITASSTITGDTDVSITANDSTNNIIRTISVTVMGICSRTAQVRDAILARISGTPDCATVTATQLAAITGILRLSSRGITTLQSGDFVGLTSLTQLRLDENNLTTIEADTFSALTSLTFLNLNDNNLTTIEANTFSALTSLTALWLRNNALTTIEANTFSGLNNLTTLLLDDNALTTIDANAFSALRSLDRLELDRNALTTIEANTFSALTSLDRLDLGENALTTIEANTFSALTSLTALWLRNNALTTINAGTFSGLTSLTQLDLGFNALTTIEADTFSALTSLTDLDLDNNALTTINAGTFSALTSLDRLDLGENALTTINAGTFSGLTSLTQLSLHNNALTAIEADTFSALTSLTRLNLNSNMLSTLPANVFDNLTNLTGLFLRFNSLTTIEANTFSGLNNLNILQLNNNDLTTIEANTFSGLTSLTTLHLFSNDLTTIEANTFSSLTALTLLNLANTGLSALPASLFDGLTLLAALRLHANTFTTPLPADIFDPLPDGALIEIDLSPIGDLADVALSVGGTTTINVANAFISRDVDGNDRMLSYNTLTPADTAVAIANETSGVVTITGAGMGATTVSVTADDGRRFGTVGMFTRDIAVTVAEAGILVFDEATGNTATTVVAAENSGTDTFYVQLASPPTSDVTMMVMSSAIAEGTVLPSELTFTTMNWNTRQAVTVTAVPDQIDRDDTFTVDFMITSGDGDDYPDTLTLSSVQVTITDDDTAGIDGYDALTGGSEISAITTSETAGTGNAATFYVQLTSQPTGTVTVTIDGLRAGEHTSVPPSTLTFTPTGTTVWSTRQEITLTGVDDSVVDGDQMYDITLTPTGGGYDSVTAPTVSITNTDDDTAGLAIADLMVDEDAGTATVTVTLTPAVTAGTVTVDAMTTDGTATTAGTDYTAIASQTLTFVAGNTSQTLDIIINDDTIDETDETFTITLDSLSVPAAVTGDVSITDATAIVTITDDDTLSNTINLSISPLTVAETADATTITVTATIDGTAVSTTPTTVTVSVGGGTATSGTDYAAVGDFTLTIPALSLSAMATFMIDPTEDTTDDNNETVMISGTATGFTVNPATLTIVEASISVHDAMTAGSQISTATIVEASGTGTLYVQLTSEPAASSSVTISVASSDTNEGTVSSPTLTFSDTNWDTRQLITVTAVPDSIDRDDTFTVDFMVMSGDGGNYTNSLILPSVTVTITDDDTLSNTINLSISPLTVAETADATTITVTATIDGTAVSTTPTTVTVSVGGGTATSGTDYAAVGDFTLTIPALSLSTMATFMIDPTEDTTDDNNETVMISGTATGFTVNPATLTIVEASISVHDAMTAGSQISTATIVEASGTGTLYVQLTSEPAASSSVTISVASSDTNEGTVSSPTLTFSDTNWDTRQLITVTAVPDSIDRDDTFTVDFMVMSGDGGNYTNSLILPSVTVTITDDDTAGITTAIGDGVTTSETGTSDTFTVALATQPTADVTVTITGLDTAEHSLAPSTTLMFTTLNWDTAQTVMLTGENDDDVDGNQIYDLTLTPTGGGYDSVTPATASITNTDDDTAELTIADLSVDEDAGTATLTVTLTSAVTAGDITVNAMTVDGTATSTDYTALTSQTLTFTAGSTSETLDITINDDNIDEVDETFTVMLDTLAQPAGVTTVSIADSTATVTITDDDMAGIDAYDMLTAGSEISTITTSETAGTGNVATFYVELTSQPTDTVTVTIGGIDAGEHTLTAPASGTLTFDSTNWNTPRQAITITGVDDNVVDGDQTYDITLTATGGGYNSVMAQTVSVTNTDDDTAEISITDMMVNEDAGTATVTVTLTPAVTTGDIMVNAMTADGTATAGVDYTAITSQTLTFAAGSTSETLDITISDDSIAEGNETFTVMLGGLSAPTGVTIATADTAEVTITDDDITPTGITLSVSQPTIADTADATEITVTATLDGTVVLAAPTDISVSVGSATDSATEGTDYVTVPNFTLTIPALLSSAIGTFTIDPNTSSTNGETITIDGTAGTFTFTATTLTIVEASILVFESQTSTTSISTFTIAEASSDTFYVELASQPAGNVTLSVESDDINEGTLSPGTLIFNTMNWNIRQPITVTAVPDNVDRDGDSFMVDFMVMSGTGNYNPATLTTLPSVAVTVSDDDTPSTDITLTISRDSIQETAGETTITVTATLDGTVVLPTETVVTVSVGDVSDSATEGSDYVEIPDFILTIPALETSNSEVFTITPITDNENDNEETITISGTATGFSTINAATLTITGFSREEQEVTEQTVAATSSGVTQVVTEQIGIRLVSRAPTSSGSSGSGSGSGGGAGGSRGGGGSSGGGGSGGGGGSDGGGGSGGSGGGGSGDGGGGSGGGDGGGGSGGSDGGGGSGGGGGSDGDGGSIEPDSLTSIDWQNRLAKFAYEGLQRLDSDADIMSLDWLLKAAGGNGQLLMPLGAKSLTLWATASRLITKGDGVGTYEGDVNSLILGVDTALANDWVVGVAASYNESEVDYTMDGNREGETQQTTYSIHPYLSHTLTEGFTVWMAGGYGFGDIDFSHTTHGQATSDTTQWMAAGGVEKQIITDTPWQGTLRLKGLWGNAIVDAATYDRGSIIDKVDTKFWRARMEGEMGYNFLLSSGNLRPYALIGARWDHNDAIVSGDEWHVDIGGGVELSDNDFALNMSLHTQLTEGDTEEHAVVATGSLTYDLEQDGQGLQITLSRPLDNTSPAFDSHSFNEGTSSGLSTAPLTSELAYGWTVRPFGLKGALQTYTQTRFDSDDRHYAVGLELVVNALTLNFESGYGEADNTGLESMVKTKIRW